jgi:hypothetical protein
LSRRNRSTSFTAACTQTVLSYVDEDGEQAVVRAGLPETKPDFVAFCAMGRRGRLAQIRYSIPRRTPAGILGLPAFHAIKTMVRKDVSPAEHAAAVAWLTAVQDRFEGDHEGVKWLQFRRVVRDAMLQFATPLHRRGSMFFCYADQLPKAQATAEFLRRCAPGWEIAVFPLVDGQGDLHTLAASADKFVLIDVLALQDQVEAWMAGKDNPKRALFSRALKQWRSEAKMIDVAMAKHETRLGYELSDTRAGLAIAEEMIQLVDPTAHLLPMNRW